MAKIGRPDHQFRINRRAPRMAIERSDVAAQIIEVETAINPTQQVIDRNVIVEIE